MKWRSRADTEFVLKVIVAVVLVLAVGAGTYALASGDDTRAKPGQHEKQERKGKPGHETRGGNGPPPWAPAYGWRCKEAGNAPGSQAFKDCIKAKKR